MVQEMAPGFFVRKPAGGFDWNRVGASMEVLGINGFCAFQGRERLRLAEACGN